MSRSHLLIAAVLAAVAAPTAWAQEPPRRPPRDPATASAPHERMAFLEGTWTLAPDSAAAGAEAAFHEETCAWLPGGRRHMVCRTTRQGAPGAPRRESLSVMSYRAADSIYVVHHAFPDGTALEYRGGPDGDRWVMELRPPPRWPANERLRTIITVVPGGLRFVEEHSVDGGPWRVTEDYRHRRVR